MKIKKRYFFIVLAFILVYISIFFWNNIKIVCVFANGFDVPSKPYYFLLERAIALTNEESKYKFLKKSLDNRKDKHLHSMYAYLLGLNGNKTSSDTLLRYYNEHYRKDSHGSTVNSVINAMGLTGNAIFIPTLEAILSTDDSKEKKGFNIYLANRSLYLITGDKNLSTDNIHFHIDSSIKYARRIIVKSVHKKRSFEEKLLLDQLFRPPGWRGNFEKIK